MIPSRNRTTSDAPTISRTFEFFDIAMTVRRIKDEGLRIKVCF
jgi:hypothetical protein